METKCLRMFVGGLSLDTTREQLMSYFQKFGEIESTEIVFDKKTSKSEFGEKIFSAAPLTSLALISQKFQKGLVLSLAQTKRHSTE